VDNLFERIFKNEILVINNPGIARQIGIISERNGLRKNIFFAWDRRNKATLIFSPSIRLKQRKKWGNGSIFDIELVGGKVMSDRMIDAISEDFEKLKKRLTI
jgi:hypothetical protein